MRAYTNYVDKQGEGGSPQCLRYFIRLCSKLVNDQSEDELNNSQNPVNVVMDAIYSTLHFKRHFERHFFKNSTSMKF